MRLLPVLALLAATSLACACASSEPVPVQNWVPRADADLKADQGACKKDAENVDIHALADSKYATVIAMASRTDEVDLTTGSVQRMREAVMYQCMKDKGWTPQP